MLSVTVDIEQTNKDIKNVNQKIVTGLSRSVRQGMIYLSNQQPGVYTQTLRPPKPQGSTYRRTFEFRSSIQKQMIRTKPPLIWGMWSTNISYDIYVIGDQQAVIHQGRWLTQDELEANLNQAFPQIIRDNLKDLF